MLEDKKLVEHGKANILGVDVNIADILGDKLVNQYIAQMMPEQTQALFEFVSSDLFTTVREFDEDGKAIDKIKVVSERRDIYGTCHYDEQSIAHYIKVRFNKKIKEKLVEAVDDIINSGAYSDTVDKLADDLVAYATEGYKEDLKQRIRERLVDNTVDSMPAINGQSLRYIIRQEISQVMNR